MWAVALGTPPLDETRVSVLDWTDAHTLAYESKVAGVTVSQREAVALLSAASDNFLCMQNIIGQTALHLAVRQNNLEIVGLYSRRGVALDKPNKDGDTPLHYAAFHNRPRAAELLLEAGANREALNDKNERPIDDAIMQGNDNMIDLLKRSMSSRDLNRPREAELLSEAGANREAVMDKVERLVDDVGRQGNDNMIEPLRRSMPSDDL